MVADGIAELQVAFPNMPIVFGETRQLAEEWTYRFLAATYAAADHSPPRPSPVDVRPEPSTAEVRAWACERGLDVPGKRRLRPEIWEAYRAAHL
ncbi:hypothetical protein Aple_033090 [Acrocarpospora pleiomorpha]|uniref:Lsr2 DNA-binding domain-containing protein n=1 Tax=Acrocarpospora pleiomorpha TaxID=90975 RepID=A0A5M3XMN5_9ACTN|nr:Lsr2 family protein [Acrocarpospora pleiomorpha]GES20413.1 hypothetical protein Aple_033090 [Acrocarpospora pleiomorpha]